MAGYRATNIRRNKDMPSYGTFKIKETVQELGNPVQRKVWLIQEQPYKPLTFKWSDPVTGDVEFTEVTNASTWTLIAYDHTATYEGVCITNRQASVDGARP